MRQLRACTGNRNSPKLTHGAPRYLDDGVKTNNSSGHSTSSISNGHRFASVETMRPFIIALLSLFAALSLPGQDDETQKKFAGTWEAKWRDKVVCTITLKAGVQLS